MNHSIITITTELNDITNESLADLYDSVGYGSAESYLAHDNFVKLIFPPGVFGFFALNEDKSLLGMIRVFSDDYICSWIAEMCISPRAEGASIKEALLKALTDRLGHTALFTEAFDEEIEVYKKFGITAKKKLTALSCAPTLGPRQYPKPFIH